MHKLCVACTSFGQCSVHCTALQKSHYRGTVGPRFRPSILLAPNSDNDNDKSTFVIYHKTEAGERIIIVIRPIHSHFTAKFYTLSET